MKKVLCMVAVTAVTISGVEANQDYPHYPDLNQNSSPPRTLSSVPANSAATGDNSRNLELLNALYPPYREGALDIRELDLEKHVTADASVENQDNLTANQTEKGQPVASFGKSVLGAVVNVGKLLGTACVASCRTVSSASKMAFRGAVIAGPVLIDVGSIVAKVTAFTLKTTYRVSKWTVTKFVIPTCIFGCTKILVPFATFSWSQIIKPGTASVYKHAIKPGFIWVYENGIEPGVAYLVESAIHGLNNVYNSIVNRD